MSLSMNFSLRPFLVGLCLTALSTAMIGCSDDKDKKNPLAEELAGSWVEENINVSEIAASDDSVIGFEISPNGNVKVLSTIKSEEKTYFMASDGMIRLHQTTEGRKISVVYQVAKVEDGKIQLRFVEGSFDGEKLDASNMEKSDAFYVRSTKSEVTQIKTAIAEADKPNQEMKAALVGTKWELVEVHNKTTGGYESEYTAKAEDIRSTSTFTLEDTQTEITCHKLKIISFDSSNKMTINNNQSNKNYKFEGLNIWAENCEGDSNFTWTEIGAITEVTATTMTIVDNYESQITETIDDKEVTHETVYTETSTYKKVN